MLLPRDKILVVYWSDWFSRENGYTVYNGGCTVPAGLLARSSSDMLDEGQSLEAEVRLRQGCLGQDEWLTVRERITNRGGEGRVETLPPRQPAPTEGNDEHGQS